ncbi:hypothetical protein NC652_002247 [Populus alba x Populus x berolinensis]|nr:hypothetical protein NC652_002247 [Populus alba x Populus x berolinensis]
MPIALHELPPDPSYKASLEEVEQVLFPIVEDLLSKHNISPRSIDILISNCSLFCPAPSITAMITNKFGLRSNIKSFSLSGMGCSAGLLSISLAKDLFSVIQQDDEDGFVGVSLSRSLLHVAGNALRTNISELGPLVLPYLEQLRYGWGVVHRKLWVAAGKRETHVPNFKKAFEHFCIHAGGRAVIDAVESNLKLQKEDGEASRMMLYRFGNTSSSSVWYELCYLEAKGAVKKGDRIWQIAFGSGFKCNSAVWKSISAPNPEERNAWSDRIHLYPVQTPIAP